MDVNAIIQLISLAISAGTNLVLAFKHNSDGTVDVNVTMTQTAATLVTDLQQAASWFATHGANTPAQTAPATPAGGSII